MRAARLVRLVRRLERGGTTAAALAAELGVSRRTVLRDLEELSAAGVPVYATRGRGGGVALVAGFTWVGATTPAGGAVARVRITERGRRTAALTGRLQPLRVLPGPPDDDGRVPATFRVHALGTAVADVLALGPDVVAVSPPGLRAAVAEAAAATAGLYAEPPRALSPAPAPPAGRAPRRSPSRPAS